LVNSLLTAIVRADGDALVMHVGERPYVVASAGPVELSSRPLTLEAVTGMLGQLLPFDARRALEELGAIEQELPRSAAAHGDRFTVVAARGGEDIWIEVRRHRKAAGPLPVVAPAEAGPTAAVRPETVGVQAPPAPALPQLTASMGVEAAAAGVAVSVTDAPALSEPDVPTVADPDVPTLAEAGVPVLTEADVRALAEADVAVLTEADVLAAVPERVRELEPVAPARVVEPIAENLAVPEPIARPVPVLAPPAEPRPREAEPLLRPLPASPIVERPFLEAFTFEQPASRSAAQDAVPAPPRPAAVTTESAPAVVLPLARNPVRMDSQSRAQPSPRIAGIDRLLRLSAARGANTLYLMAQARPSVRVDGEIAVLEGEPVLSAHEVESLLLDLAPERSREALEAGEGTEWMSEVPEVGRIRCQSFRDHRGPGGIFRMISARPTTAEQLGLAREIQALCAEPEGLILVAGPRASGKSTLVSSLVDLINRTRNDYVITVESQVKFVHESRGCLVSQREVRGGNEDLAVVVRGALRENPDVLVIEDIRSPEVVRLALEAMEAGHLVIGAVSAHGAAPAIGKVLDQSPEERRTQMRLALAEGLRGVVSQVLLRKTAGGRVAAREVLLNMPSIANLIAEGRVSQLPLAIDSGRKHGMVPLNDALAAFVQSGVVDVKEAYRKAFERQAFVAVLRREGVDTSFLERLA
jgi:twitching motility protein PilT